MTSVQAPTCWVVVTSKKKWALAFSTFMRDQTTHHGPMWKRPRSTWRTGAERACLSAEYDELNIRENEKDTGLQNSAGVRYLVTERTGYAKCDSSTLSNSEINKIINKDSAIR
jgi:hypothetical protein